MPALPRVSVCIPVYNGEQFLAETMRSVLDQTYRAAVRCLVDFDERANLGGIVVPVLCLAGEKDPNAPAAVLTVPPAAHTLRCTTISGGAAMIRVSIMYPAGEGTKLQISEIIHS